MKDVTTRHFMISVQSKFQSMVIVEEVARIYILRKRADLYSNQIYHGMWTEKFLRFCHRHHLFLFHSFFVGHMLALLHHTALTISSWFCNTPGQELLPFLFQNYSMTTKMFSTRKTLNSETLSEWVFYSKTIVSKQYNNFWDVVLQAKSHWWQIFHDEATHPPCSSSPKEFVMTDVFHNRSNNCAFHNVSAPI